MGLPLPRLGLWRDRRKRSKELSRVLKGPVASPSWEEEGWGSVRLLSPLRTRLVSVVVVCQPLWGGASENEELFF